MIELKPMEYRIREILVSLVVIFIFFFLPIVSAVASDSDSGYTHISREAVDDTVARLIAGEDYKYDESDLDDPAWMLWLREKLANIQKRWDASPVSIMPDGGFSVVGIFLAVALLIVIIGFIFARLMGWDLRRAGAGIGNGFIDEKGGIVGWGEDGASRAVELAALGKFREAVSVLFRSALRGLDNSGWIRYRKSGGSRNYLRQLRRSEELYPLFRNMLGRFEVAYYCKGNPDEEDWVFMYDTYGDLARTATTARNPEYMRRG